MKKEYCYKKKFYQMRQTTHERNLFREIKKFKERK